MTDPTPPANLNTATDELNELWDNAEDAIRALKLGVMGQVSVVGVNGALSWDKSWRGEWGLSYVYPPGTHTPIRSTARTVRIAATTVLPELVAELHRNVGLQTVDARAAVARIRDFLATITDQKT